MASERHCIVAQETDSPLVVDVKGEQFVLEDLDAATARLWHRKLSATHEPHLWQMTDGGATGWNSVAGLYVAADARELVMA